MNRNFAQQNAERRLRHCRWADDSRSIGTNIAAGFLSGLLFIMLLSYIIAGREFFL